MSAQMALTDIAQVQEVIGFDLGHGETALAKTQAQGKAPPQMLEIYGRRSQMTAVARFPDGEVLIGEEAIEQPGAVEFEVCFKKRPDQDARYHEVMRLFVGKIYDELRARTCVMPDRASRFYGGCPSGWKQHDIDAYQAMLARSGIPDLAVVKESHAALVQALEGELLSKRQILGPVMVIDIGSSTTDFTFRKDPSSPTVSAGCDLGGALIDRAILQEVLSVSEDRVQIEGELQRSPREYNLCLLQCRKLKEKYFRKPERIQGLPITEEPYKVAERYRFCPRVEGAAGMQRILARPLGGVHGSRSWPQAFREACIAERDRMAGGITKGTVLLTGGASRMVFVHEICKEVFSGWDLCAGTEPEYTIALGLARYGRLQLKTASFDADVLPVRDAIPGVVESFLPALIDRLAKSLAAGLMADVIRPKLVAWRDGRTQTLRHMKEGIESGSKRWIGSPDARRIIDEELQSWSLPVRRELSRRLQPLVEKYHLPADVLAVDWSYDPTFSAGSGFAPDVAELQETIGNVAALIVVIIGALVVAISAAITLGVGSLVVIAAGALFGKAAVEEKLMDWDMPGPVRQWGLNDAKIAVECSKQLPVIEGKLKKSMLEDAALKQQLTGGIISVLDTNLSKSVEDARILLH